MRKSLKNSLNRVFVSLFLILYTFVPSVKAIDFIVEEATIENGIQEDVVPDTPIIIEEDIPIWNQVGNIYTTNNLVVLGETYIFPSNSDVSVTFTKLPEQSSTLSIEEITLTQEEIDATGSISNKAYDITTDMVNGTFEYDLTLPSNRENTKVVYVEEREDIFTNVREITNTVVNEGDTVRIEDLEHFTIFIVETSGNSPVLASGAVNNQTQVTVFPSALITVTIKAITSGRNSEDDWHSSQYRIGDSDWECVNTEDHNGDGTYTESFDINAPFDVGSYDLSLNVYNGDNCSGGSDPTPYVMKEAITVVPPVTNPPLPTEACGLDIALVLDVSGSINTTELAQMKSAFVAFVDALAGTPTQFSVTEFATTANILQPFTADIALVKSAINSAGDGGFTNWEDGLNKALSTYDPRNDKPNLMIFSSDGNPNRTGVSGTYATESQAVAAAVVVADTIKTAGTRILALGIGSDLDTANMIAISGPNVNTGILTSDVITSDFADLAKDLGELASRTCGGTISVKKYIDNTSTPGGAGWQYSIAGTSSLSLSTSSDGTANTGKIPAGTYSITEINIPSGYSYGSAICRDQAGSIVGSIISNGWGNISIDDSDIISCDFINTRTGTIIVHKDVVGPHGEDISDGGTYSVKLNNGSPQTIGNGGTVTFNGVVAGNHTIYETSLPTGSVLVSITPDSDTTTEGAQVTLAANQTLHVYVTNRKNIPSIYGSKFKDVNANGIYNSDVDLPLSGWTIFIDSNGNGQLDTGELSTTTNAQGEYSFLGVPSGLNIVCEQSQTGWAQSFPTDNNGCHRVTVGTLGAANAVVEGIDFLNYETPTLTVIKNILNDHGGTATVNDFEIKVGTNLITFGAGVVNGSTTTYTSTPSVLPNVSYLLSEKDVTGYIEGTWNCVDDATGATVSNPVLLSPGQNVTCTITNNDQSGSIRITKDVVPNNSSKWNFTITTSIPGAGGPYSIPGIGDGLGDGDSHALHGLMSGPYTITETSDSNYATSISCNDGSTATGNSINVDVSLGEELECTFTNTRNTGSLKVRKLVDWGNVTDWSFALNEGSPIIPDSDGYVDFGQVNTGETHTIIEYGPFGTHYLGSISGTNCTAYGSSGATATVLPGGETICTFNNLVYRGSITVTKVAIPNNSPQTFSFLTTGVGLSSFILDDNDDAEYFNTESFRNLLPGSYSITETIPSGWDLNSLICTSSIDGKTVGPFIGTNVASFGLEAGENVECIFTNTQRGKIITEKQTLPSQSSQLFDFTSNFNPIFSLSDGQTYPSDWLIAGIYSVSETIPQGWDLTNTICSDGSPINAINLQPGEIITCVFTNTQRGSIDVHKFVDKNANGSKEAGEPAYIFGLQMELFSSTDCTGTRITQGTTNSSGNISFNNLLPGNYSVKESVPSGYLNSTPICQYVYVGPGEPKSLDFGNIRLGHINVSKFNDLNGNGMKDSGEPGLEGWTINLVGPNGYSKSEVTNADGNVAFRNLEYGTYTYSEVMQSGWIETIPSGGRTYSYNINYDTSESAINARITNFQLGSISGQKFEDLNGNGTKDSGESSLSSWTIELDKNADGTVDSTTITDSNGNYIFTGLTAGTYRVREQLESGWTQTTSNPSDITILSGTNSTENDFGNFENITVTACKEADMDGLYSTSNDRFPVDNWSVSLIKNGSIIDTDSTTLEPGDGCHSWINLGPGTYGVSEEQRTGWTNLNSTTHSFGSAQSGQNFLYRFVNTQLGSISGIKWEDMNANGVRDAEDEGLDNWTIKLDKDGDGTIDFTTTTNSNGIYIFEDLLPGTYKIIEDSPYPWNVSYPSAGVNYYDGVVLSAGSNLLEYDFGNYKNGSIEGYKWEDTNRDGIYDSNEQAPNSQWEIKLWKEINGEKVSQPGSVFSQADGYFGFGVSPGIYYLTEVLKSGWTQTYPNTEFLGPIEITSGEISINNNFGNFENGTIYVDKYEDTDGILGSEGREESLIGDPTFTFRLYYIEDTQWTLIGEEDTNSSGKASFENQMSSLGEYKICEIKKDGWEDMRSLFNPANNLSGATDEYPVCEGISLTTSGYSASLEFENAKLSDIHGYKWQDINGNGYRDCSDELLERSLLQENYCREWAEPLLSDWTINLYRWNGEDYGEEPIESTTTDDTDEHFGWYWFEDLLPGQYKVCEVPQDGWLQSFPINENDNCHIITLPDDNPNTYPLTVNFLIEPEPEYNFGNYVIPPELEIEKLNDTGGLGMSTEDIVTYTIIVKAPEDDTDGEYLLKNVVVTDILPEGFEYILGSWTGTTNEPVYNGVPAKWEIGDMEEGDIVILTYKALISTTQEPGLYPDIAWVSGEDILEGSVLGVSSVEPTENFVGTEVLVIAEEELEEGEVLGATTIQNIELPSTGANILITIGAIVSMILGFILLLFKPKKKVNVLLLATTLLLGMSIFLTPKATYASENEKINVQISQPQTPTNKTSFRISYVALDLDSRPLTIECLETTYGKYATHSTYSGTCLVDSSILTGSGTYTFTVKATANDGSGDYKISKPVTVVVDLEMPTPITNYTKTEGICTYILSFTTGSKSTKVQIFRSTVQPFSANASTLIKEISVSPNQSVTYTDTIPVCGQEYFYAVRSVDSVSNTSPIVTDPIIQTVEVQGEATTTTTTTQTTTPTSTTPTAVTVQESEDAEVKGEEETPEDTEKVEKEESEEIGEEKEDKTEEKSNIGLIVIVVIFLAGGIGYMYVRNRKTTY